MKTMLTFVGRALAGALAAACLVTSAHAASGGPDGDGYTWRDNAEPGITYAWEDISVTGTDITQPGDDFNLGFQPLSFAFPYYGTSYTQVAICSNGWVSLVDGSASSLANGTLPRNDFVFGTIAAYWDDLVIEAGITRILFQDFGNRAVITFEDIEDYSDRLSLMTFQVILYADGRIAVQYFDLSGARTDATLGIESPNEAYGLTVFSDDPSGMPAASYRVEFAPPVPLANVLSCGSAVPVSCGQRVSGNLSAGTANQSAYRCSLVSYTGREQLYRLDLAAPADLRIFLEASSGNPDLIVLAGCDPNACLAPPGDVARITGASGSVYLVVDAVAGSEGAYRLRIDCLPIAATANCAGAPVVACGDRISGNTATGSALQNAYACTELDYGGRENVYTLDLAVPTDLRIALDTLSGNPDLIVLRGCDPNTCLSGPADRADLFGVSGIVTLIVDSPPGQEGPYDLRIDCNPTPNLLDCGNAPYVDCGDLITADLATGQSRQDSYWCGTRDYSGREHVYLLDIPSPTNVGITLTQTGAGNPDVILVNACDVNNCTVLDGGQTVIPDAVGTFYIVVDASAGEEGPYELLVECLFDSMEFCNGPLLELDPWFDPNGSWLVEGWLYHPGDTHNFALRVDDDPLRTYSHDGGGCPQFDSVSFGSPDADGPAFTQWTFPEGVVRMDMRETNAGGCCGLLVTMTVRNTDTTPHAYEFRVYHDTAFGEGSGTGACFGGTIDGGPMASGGTTYMEEVDLLAVGGDTCAGQVQLFSADDTSYLRSSYQMLPPNLPTSMEYLQWNNGGSPCTQWKSLVDGDVIGTCGTDNSLLFIWQFPFGGTLAPGATATAQYRIGWECAWPCLGCESPTLSTGTVSDIGPCADGLRLDWAAATFPGAGNGVYHVYRSEVSAAAAFQPTNLITPLSGLATNFYIDNTTQANTSYYYVIQAESTDFPGCGLGPAVYGSTAEIQPIPQPIMDFADVVGPADTVGNSLRATDHTDTTVDFNWLLAPPPLPGERYVVLRSDDDPEGPFVRYAEPVGRVWTDLNAPPRFEPVHVWFYDVRLVDACGNYSESRN